MIKIASDRLILKVLPATSAAIVQDYLVRNKAFFQPWVPTYPKDYFELNYIRTYLQNIWRSISMGQMLHLYIFHQTDDQQNYILGDLIYTQIQRGSSSSCCLGYKIDEKANGQGIATEAIRAANDYMLHKAKMHRIEAQIMPRNKGSLRVVEKLGFEREGYCRKRLKINGVWEDHIQFAILNEGIENEL